MNQSEVDTKLESKTEAEDEIKLLAVRAKRFCHTDIKNSDISTNGSLVRPIFSRLPCYFRNLSDH